MTTSCIERKLKNSYILGGTSTCILDNWSNRFICMGRWIGVKIHVDDYTNLHCIPAYQVCNQSVKITTSLSIYTQQYMLLQNLGYDKPNPRQQILDDLELYIKSIPPNDYIIIGIDANKSMQDMTTNISKFTINTQLLDAYGKNFKTEEFSTHVNGSKRIDYILCSRNTQLFITKTAY
jgi:hypothetical protein